MTRTATDYLKDEAKTLASSISAKVGSWMDDLLDQASEHTPDTEAVRASAESALGDVTAWLEDLPARIGSMLPQPVPQKKSPTKAIIGGAALGAAAVYFLDRNEGKRRRKHVIETIKGWLGKSPVSTAPTANAHENKPSMSPQPNGAGPVEEATTTI